MEIVCDRAMYIIFPHFIFMHALDSYDAELNGETVDVMRGEGMIMTMKLATDEMKYKYIAVVVHLYIRHVSVIF